MPPTTQFIPESGMTEEHFEKFRETAREEKVIAIVRNTNRKSTELIQRGCPGKPKEIEGINTDELTGVVTAKTDAHRDKARSLGYYVVEPGGHVAKGSTVVNGKEVQVELKLQNPFWKVAPGQLIDPISRKPVVGDYDLMGIVDPGSPGRNIALVASNEQELANVESPIVRRFKDRVNPKLDIPRVLHGAYDQFAGFKGGATVFFPNGDVELLPEQKDVEKFYKDIGRQTRIGQYTSPVLPSGNGIRSLSTRNFSFKPSERGRAIARNQAAMEMLGQAVGASIQWLGDIGIRRQIRNSIATTHRKEIEEALDRGDGVLVIVRMQEWDTPDFNGMRARALLGVYVQSGPTQDAALELWRRPKLLAGPPPGWRTYTEFFWIDPNY